MSRKIETLTRGEALPCPFCGSQPTIEPWHGGGPRKRRVGCDNDQCGPGPAVCGNSKNAALRQWNTRLTSTKGEG